MNSGIYAIRNMLNDKRYIGHSTNFIKREKVHFDDLRGNRHFNIQLQRAVDKHGIDNFTFEVLEETEGTKEYLVNRENYYITQFNSISNGYNLTEAHVGGGDNISTHPNNSLIREKASIRVKQEYKDGLRTPLKLCGIENGMYGKKRPQEIINRMMVGKKTWLETHTMWNKGIPMSAEQKQKISQANKGHKRWVGKHHTKETKQKLSEIKKEWAEKRRQENSGIIPGPIITREHTIKFKTSKNLPFVIVNNIEYVSCREATELTGEKVCRHRLTSPNIKFTHMYWSNNKKTLQNNKQGKSYVVFEHKLTDNE